MSSNSGTDRGRDRQTVTKEKRKEGGKGERRGVG